MTPILRSIYRVLAGDQRGMAFLEFALVVPLMLCLLLGSVLGGELMVAYMKVNDAAQVSVDLITQCSNGVSGGGAPGAASTTGDLQNFGNAALGVIYPLNTGNMTLAFASVTLDSTGKITGAGGGADWVWPTGATILTSATAVTQVQNLKLIQAGLAGSVVIVNTQYTYNLPFTFKIPGLGGNSYQPFAPTYTFTANGYSFPRYVSKILLQATIPNPNPPATNPDLYCP
jgi:Flp pilus assembly protein TadG